MVRFCPQLPEAEVSQSWRQGDVRRRPELLGFGVDPKSLNPL